MTHAEVWTGREIDRFEGIQALLRSAQLLIGRDDPLASVMVTDAAEALDRLIGHGAVPVTAAVRGDWAA